MGKIIHPVPKEHLEQIGNIVVSFALLENELKQLIESLLETKEQRISRIIAAELSF